MTACSPVSYTVNIISFISSGWFIRIILTVLPGAAFFGSVRSWNTPGEKRRRRKEAAPYHQIEATKKNSCTRHRRSANEWRLGGSHARQFVVFYYYYYSLTFSFPLAVFERVIAVGAHIVRINAPAPPTNTKLQLPPGFARFLLVGPRADRRNVREQWPGSQPPVLRDSGPCCGRCGGEYRVKLQHVKCDSPLCWSGVLGVFPPGECDSHERLFPSGDGQEQAAGWAAGLVISVRVELIAAAQIQAERVNFGVLVFLLLVLVRWPFT